MNSAQVAARAGVSTRQLDTWVGKGWLKPLEVPGPGRGGMTRDWGAREVDVACRMGKLVEAGLAAGVAASIARGDRVLADGLLAALAPCVDELRWRWHSSDPGVSA